MPQITSESRPRVLRISVFGSEMKRPIINLLKSLDLNAGWDGALIRRDGEFLSNSLINTKIAKVKSNGAETDATISLATDKPVVADPRGANAISAGDMDINLDVLDYAKKTASAFSVNSDDINIVLPIQLFLGRILPVPPLAFITRMQIFGPASSLSEDLALVHGALVGPAPGGFKEYSKLTLPSGTTADVEILLDGTPPNAKSFLTTSGEETAVTPAAGKTEEVFLVKLFSGLPVGTFLSFKIDFFDPNGVLFSGGLKIHLFLDA